MGIEHCPVATNRTVQVQFEETVKIFEVFDDPGKSSGEFASKSATPKWQPGYCPVMIRQVSPLHTCDESHP